MALNLPEQVPELLKKGRLVIQMMSPPNKWFTNNAPTTPTLAVFATDLNNLEACETAAATRATGAVAARNAALITVEKDFKHIGAFVQQTCDANPGSEEAIATSAGLELKTRGGPPASVFRAEYGDNSGTIVLHAPHVADGMSNYWESSMDQKTWVSYPETVKGTITITGLTPGTIYYFRHKVLARSGMSDWSQIISIMVK